MIKRRHRKWTMLSFNTHTNAIKAQSSKLKAQSSKFEVRSSKFEVQSVGAYSKLVFIGAGGAQSPFRPYG
ncbi:hypothetical protein ABFV43_22040, partial [Pseudomonas fulva]|uniref:hypothetical protein n=1 Tax=Pseudomonas fulva TaxID=47880 RepID=UPI0034D415E9